MLFSGWVLPMIGRRAACLLGCSFVFLGALWAFQRPFRQFPGVEYFTFELPPDWQTPGEWAFARLMFPPGPNDGYAGRFDGDFRQGLSLWTQDYPRADRHFSQALRRLTRIPVRSVEQSVMMEDGDEAFNWPWIYAVQVGEWGFTEQEAKTMREYLLRGGFFMADDFHGDYEWEMFLKRIRFVFPDRPIVDIPNGDAIFHTVFDLNDRFQIPGAARAAPARTGGAFTTTRAASWWPSRTTPMWAMRGNTRMIRGIRRSFRDWRFGSAWTTLFMR
jgi:hypothetical protein